MKKSYLLAIVLSAMFLSFTVSCSKSEESAPTPDNPINHDNPLGVYNPGKKIRRIYHKEPGSDIKYLDQVWQWEGDFLESIKDYRQNGSVNYVEQFVYDGQRLSRIEYTEGDYRGCVVFNYENNELKSTECYGPYDYSSLRSKAKFENRNGELSKIVFQTDYYDISMQFTWNHDNVSMISITGNDEFNNTAELYYDQNNNPYKGFLSYWDFCLDTWDFIAERSSFSFNNVTKVVYSNPIRNEVYNFIYQYDEDGYPIEQQTEHGTYNYRTYYYEYE